MKDERPIFQLDAPFVGCGTAMLLAMLAPLMWLAAVRFVPVPPGVERAAYHAGALAMCLDFARAASAPKAQADAICAEMVAELEGPAD
jgi:hypothetical protein